MMALPCFGSATKQNRTRMDLKTKSLSVINMSWLTLADARKRTVAHVLHRCYFEDLIITGKVIFLDTCGYV